MDVRHARALLPSYLNVHVEPHQPNREAALLYRLACWAIRFSPTVALDPPDGLLIDAAGLAGLYPKGGEAGLARAVARDLVRLGLATRIAIAPTYACARAVARFGRQPITLVPDGGQREALAPLPVAALGVDARTHAHLLEVGLSEIGHVLRLPGGAVASQFGQWLPRYLDQALGLAPEVLSSVRAVPPPRAELLFDGPTDRWEPLEAAAREVLDGLLAHLHASGQEARQLDMEIMRPYGRRERHRVRLSRASRSRKHLWSMLQPQLERIDAGAGIEGVCLTASGLTTVKAAQSVLGRWNVESDAPDIDAVWGETVDALSRRLGAANVVRFEMIESHLPERAFRAISCMERQPAARAARVTDHDRPTRLFISPVAATVMLQVPEGPLLHLTWKGKMQRVIDCVGPERISHEWWRIARSVDGDRDYFRVQTEDGTWLWVAHQIHAKRWSVHGDWA